MVNNRDALLQIFRLALYVLCNLLDNRKEFNVKFWNLSGLDPDRHPI